MSKANDNPYLVDGKPDIKMSFCAYLDILGFKEMIIEAFKQNTYTQLLNRLRSAIMEKSELIKSPGYGRWHVKAFTDNIVLGCPFLLDRESEFGFVSTEMAYHQMDLALEGFFVRGGLSMGPLYMDENIAFGTGLINAHEIEQKLANNPRIVLDTNVTKLVIQHMEEYYAFPQESPQNSFLLIDFDGQVFINYLYTSIGDEDYVNSEALIKHKNNIENNLKKFRKDKNVFPKYSWLAAYHNYFCSTIRDNPGYSESFIIASSKKINKFKRLTSILSPSIRKKSASFLKKLLSRQHD